MVTGFNNSYVLFFRLLLPILIISILNFFSMFFIVYLDNYKQIEVRFIFLIINYYIIICLCFVGGIYLHSRPQATLLISEFIRKKRFLFISETVIIMLIIQAFIIDYLFFW